MLNVGKVEKLSSIKREEQDCEISSHILPEQLNWQLAQSSTMEGVKLEPDVAVAWRSSESMASWQMPREQLDSSYEETEYISGYDLDLDNSVRNRNMMTLQRAGKRSTSTESAASKRKREITSDTKLPEIFRFFGNVEKVQDCNAKPGAVSATCNACQTRIKGFITVTSNFIKHLRLKHFEVHAAFVNAKQVGNTEGTEVYETDSFDNRVMGYIIDMAVPLATVETHSFRNMFKGTNLRVMSRSKLEMRLDEQFHKMCTSIKNKIADNKYVCTSADIWLTKHCSYFAYTCHWLNQKYQRNSVALACKRYSGESSQILETINRINTEFDLNNLKIVATVTNNSSNFSKAFKEFGINCNVIGGNNSPECGSYYEEYSESELQNNILPNQIKCASHTLNYIASTDFVQLLAKEKALKERHTKIIEKCSSLWRKATCPKTSETISAVLGEALITPVVTKSNSIYDSICCLLSHKEKLPELCSKLALHNSCFSASDIQYLEEYRILMTPIASTIEFLQMDNNLFYGCLIPALTSLCVKLKRVSDASELIELNNVAIGLQKTLKKRFSKYVALAEDINNAIIASVLCPSVKMRWFNALAKVSQNGRSAEEIHKIVINEAVRHAKASENAYQISHEHTLPKKKDDFYEFDELDDAGDTSDLDTSQPSPIQPTSKLTDEVESQLHSYLRDTGTNFEVLEKYPLLQDLAIKYNTPLTSAAPVERLLSFGNIMKYSRTTDLSDILFEKLVLLKSNNSY